MTRRKKKRGLNLKIEAMASYEWIRGLFFLFFFDKRIGGLLCLLQVEVL